MALFANGAFAICFKVSVFLFKVDLLIFFNLNCSSIQGCTNSTNVLLLFVIILGPPALFKSSLYCRASFKACSSESATKVFLFVFPVV